VKRKKKPLQQSAHPGPPKRKISEMIQEFAGDFIRLGKTPEDKQNYLNGACVAWNIASAPAERSSWTTSWRITGCTIPAR